MTMNITPADGYVEIQVDGRLVASCAEAAQAALDKALEGSANLLLDLSKMTHIDSSGLGLLVRALQKSRAAGGEVRLACLQAHPRIVFDITKVFRVFEIFDTVEEARKAFAP